MYQNHVQILNIYEKPCMSCGATIPVRLGYAVKSKVDPNLAKFKTVCVTCWTDDTVRLPYTSPRRVKEKDFMRKENHCMICEEPAEEDDQCCMF